jgi:hypothetical protein
VASIVRSVPRCEINEINERKEHCSTVISIPSVKYLVTSNLELQHCGFKTKLWHIGRVREGYDISEGFEESDLL